MTNGTMPRPDDWQPDYHAAMDAMVRQISDEYIARRGRHLPAYLERAAVFMGQHPHGTVADLGCGLGELAAVLSRLASVERVFALDYSPALVRTVRERCLDLLGANRDRVEICVGRFEDTGFSGSFFDFVFEKDAFHHAGDLHAVARETRRILKPGGWFIGFDRVLRDEIPNVEIGRRLDMPLEEELHSRYGFEGRPVSRREMGEHEVRRCEWLEPFVAEGFKSYVVQVFPLDAFAQPARFLLRAAYGLAGDFLLSRRIALVPYVNWFADVRHSMILCQKID